MSTDNQTTSVDEPAAASELDAAELQSLRERVEELEGGRGRGRRPEEDDHRRDAGELRHGVSAVDPREHGGRLRLGEVVVFHTFWGLDILHEEKSTDLKLSAVGNPNMPVRTPSLHSPVWTRWQRG